MKLVLESLGIVSLLELCIWLPGVRRLRKPLAALLVVLLAAVNGALVVEDFSFWTVLILLASGYRVINMLRIIEARMHEQYLRRVTFRTGYRLIIFQAFLVGLWALLEPLPADTALWLGLFAVAEAIVAAVLLASTLRHIRKSTVQTPQNSEDRLPTVTVAIPARNETEALEACLHSVIASNYPKLEILVLDDCSQDSRTSEIIRSFAHDGVRFIKGTEPADNWLAKNQAYQRLLEEANGELVLFCGVDVRLEPDSIRALVATMLERNKSMVSILPRNVPSDAFLDSLVQPMRYAWELALPRKLFKRPPVLSTCWLVRRDLLKRAGGFEAVSRMVVPVSHFARISAATNDGYSFLRSSAQLAISSVKSAQEQGATAIRTRYPQLHKSPEQVFLVTLAELAFLIGPIVVLLATLFQHDWWTFALALAACVLLECCCVITVSLTYRKFMPASLYALPVAVFFDLGLLHASMWQYEFSVVTWKGRNVCLPVMHVIAHLPKA